jgi:antirestriction protein ArdC
MVLAVSDEGVRRADRARSPLPRKGSTPGAAGHDEKTMDKDSNNQFDVHQSITNSIIAAIEAGASKAKLPWHRTGASSILAKNVTTGNAYNGIKFLALWGTAQERAYTHSLWATYKQFQSLD